MEPRLAALKVLLEGIEGAENAVTADSLAERLGLVGKNRGRLVRMMIEELLFNHGTAVLASTGDPPGYFSPRTWAEWQEYDRVITDRIKETCKRKAQTKKNVFNYFHGAKVVKLV